MTDIIRILVAEKNPVLRAGLCSFLATAESKYEVVSETDNYKDLLIQIEQTQPHIVFLDISLCMEKNENVTLEAIYSFKSNCHIVVMMDEYDFACFVQCLSHGARGVITKNINAEELERVVRQVIQQQRFISDALVDMLIDHLCEQRTLTFGDKADSFPTDNDLPTVETLTSREREVLDLVAQGLSNKKIAEHLSLSVGAVKFHLSNVLSKLQLENRVQATLFTLGRFYANGYQNRQLD